LPKTDSINLIDMPGINILDEQDLRFANTVIQRTSAIPILVLPASLDSVTAAELAYEYVKLGIRGIIFTQLDTARRYGSLITAPAGCNLPIIGLSYTPLIGEKLRLPYYPLINGILENSMI
jgi:flagellar biosynthesis GTPase FlhF